LTDVRSSDTPIYNTTGAVTDPDESGAYHAMRDIVDDGENYNTTRSVREDAEEEDNYQTANLAN
jgi:hypothetical protein